MHEGPGMVATKGHNYWRLLDGVVSGYFANPNQIVQHKDLIWAATSSPGHPGPFTPGLHLRTPTPKKTPPFIIRINYNMPVIYVIVLTLTNTYN